MELVEELYNKVLEKPLSILSIFNDFFGEELVDMQGFPTLQEIKENLKERSVNENLIDMEVGEEGFILVRFPHVTVTNENDQSTEINDLWARINILKTGEMTGRFLLNRSNYTLLHLFNNYMHSHISCIPTDDFTQFQNPCTGSGPINQTIASLNAGYDKDIWRLFCLELSKYVTVESLRGIPYHRLSELRLCSSIESNSTLSHERCVDPFRQFTLQYDVIAEFIVYLIKHIEIPFNYIDGKYSLAELPIDFILKVSDLFIFWYNRNKRLGHRGCQADLDTLRGRCIVASYTLANGKLYTNSASASISRFNRYIGEKVCTFKGNDITISISDLNDYNSNSIWVLDSTIISYILTKILNIVNYEYNRESTSDEATSSKKVRYL